MKKIDTKTKIEAFSKYPRWTGPAGLLGTIGEKDISGSYIFAEFLAGIKEGAGGTLGATRDTINPRIWENFLLNHEKKDEAPYQRALKITQEMIKNGEMTEENILFFANFFDDLGLTDLTDRRGEIYGIFEGAYRDAQRGMPELGKVTPTVQREGLAPGVGSPEAKTVEAVGKEGETQVPEHLASEVAPEVIVKGVGESEKRVEEVPQQREERRDIEKAATPKPTRPKIQTPEREQGQEPPKAETGTELPELEGFELREEAPGGVAGEAGAVERRGAAKPTTRKERQHFEVTLEESKMTETPLSAVVSITGKKRKRIKRKRRARAEQKAPIEAQKAEMKARKEEQEMQLQRAQAIQRIAEGMPEEAPVTPIQRASGGKRIAKRAIGATIATAVGAAVATPNSSAAAAEFIHHLGHILINIFI